MPPSLPAEQRLDAELLRRWRLPDHQHSDKEERGTVVVVGGTAHTPGAVVLAGNAALRAGAGRLQIVTDARTANGVAVALPEALVIDFDTSDSRVIELVAGADAVVVGPGLFGDPATTAIVELVFRRARSDAILIVDAAAIDALRTLGTVLTARRGRVIITPNRDELRSLVGAAPPHRELELVAADVVGGAVVCFERVAAPDGWMWTDPLDVSGLGTSGAGDVLAGIAGGIAARSRDADQAACWAALTHREAARQLAASKAGIGYLARELVDAVPAAMAVLAGSPDRSPQSATH